MTFLIATLSIILSLFFTYNLKQIIEKIRSGKITNKLSVLATTALIFHFFSIFAYFAFGYMALVLISEAYTLGCLIYLTGKK